MKRRERIIAGIFALITSLMFWATALRNVAAARSIWVDLVWVAAAPGIVVGGFVAMAVSGNVHNFNTVILIVVSGFTNACTYYWILRLLFKRRRTSPADAQGK
jgi:hypothetical protein